MYVTAPFNVYVDPKQVKRVHAPLEKSLTFEPEYQGYCLHLRTCERGVDEYGATVKYLYCTRDGRFFVRGKDGWNEILPTNINRHSKNPACGGGYDCPQLRMFGYKPAHRCVAFAWLKVPKQVISQMYGAYPMPKWEVDHLNTDHKNWSADNLQWVTADENRRRGKIAKRLRKAGIDPKLLTPTLCKGIYALPQADEDWVGEFIERYKYHCSKCPLELSVDAIRLCAADALDNVKSQISNDQ